MSNNFFGDRNKIEVLVLAMSNMIVILVVLVILNVCISTNAINSNETDVRRRLGGNDMINGPITSAMIGKFIDYSISLPLQSSLSLSIQIDNNKVNLVQKVNQLHTL